GGGEAGGVLRAGHGYDAACAAALAGAAKGKDEPLPDEEVRTKWRKQALTWLTADLAAWAATLTDATPAARENAAKMLTHWQKDSDLAGVRDDAALTKLPEAEQKDWRMLWEAVREVQQKAESGK